MSDSNVVPMSSASTAPAEDSLDAIQTAVIVFSRLRENKKPTTQTVKEMIVAAKKIQEVAAGPMAEAMALHAQMVQDLNVAIGIVPEVQEATPQAA